MISLTRRRFGATAAVGLLGVLAACSSAESGTEDALDKKTREIEDNSGKVTVPTSPTSVVATDNRTFESLQSWGIELSAAAVALMPSTNPYTKDDSIVDLGNHREPDLESVVAVEPDLIVNGQRFSQYREKFEELAPDAAIIDLDPREDKPFDEELKRQTTVLGQIFGKEKEAKKLTDAFDASVDRARKAYDKDATVLSVIVSGGEIGYVAPTVGRTLGPVHDILELTPALEVKNSDDDHEGDDISVEAIAKANPDWLLVMDRDAAINADDPSYEKASSVLEASQALTGVSAVQKGNIVYMPADTYTNESIQTYTEFFESVADAFEGSGN